MCQSSDELSDYILDRETMLIEDPVEREEMLEIPQPRHPMTGLKALHLAVGTNNLKLTRYLIEEAGAQVCQDRSGRWPSLITALCQSSEELSDYILERETMLIEDPAEREIMLREFRPGPKP